jgi:predicted neuraminidase
MKSLPLIRSLLALASVTLVSVTAAEPVLLRHFLYERASFPQCHASTIVETKAGSVIAAFFGGTHEKHPDVGIWVSRRDGNAWSAPVEVADGVQFTRGDGTVVRYPTWNPVLFQPSEGPLMLFYKVGPHPETWWGMVMTSSDDGRTWSEPRRLPEGVLGPIKNKPVELADGTILCPSSAENKETGWTVHFELTKDLGKTWTVVGPINTKDQFNAIQPSVLFHQDGRLQVLCRSRENVVTTSWSSDQGRTWSPMTATNLGNPSSGTDAVTLKDGRQLLVYNPKPSTVPRDERRWPLLVAVSDDGMNWRDVATLESEPASAGYSYPAVIQTSDGKVHITYTWKRERISHVVMDPTQF